jgi:hypothetical protein
MTAHAQHTTHLMGSFPLQGGHHDCCTIHNTPQIEWQSMNPRARPKSHQEQATLKRSERSGDKDTAHTRQRHGKTTAKARQRHGKALQINGKRTASDRQDTANARKTHGKGTARTRQRIAKTRQTHGKSTAKRRQRHGKITAKARQRHNKDMAKTRQRHGQIMATLARTWQTHGKATAETWQQHNKGIAFCKIRASGRSHMGRWTFTSPFSHSSIVGGGGALFPCDATRGPRDCGDRQREEIQSRLEGGNRRCTGWLQKKTMLVEA